MQKILSNIFILTFVFILISCAGSKEKKDTSDLYKKSQTRGEIISRSGTMLQAGSKRSQKEAQMNDAQNRLRTGGGLLGKKPTNLVDLVTGGNSKNQIASLGMPINPYLWKGSLETLEFMSFASVDPMSGIIITDWYTAKSNINERCKVNVFIKGLEFKTDNLKVNTFCQTLSSSNTWVNQNSSENDDVKIENAILNKAKKIRLTSIK